MSKLEDFKTFVRDNPKLINYVKNDSMSWQKFYEMYDLYGSDNSIWDKYLNKTEVVAESTKAVGFADVLGWLKNIDLDSFQNNINSIQRVVGVLQDLGTNETKKETYKPRPVYKHFED